MFSTLDKLSYGNFSGVDYKCAVPSSSEGGSTDRLGHPENLGDVTVIVIVLGLHSSPRMPDKE